MPDMANNTTIMLVEDNPDDEDLTMRALKKHNITNQVVVSHDGVEALDYLFGTGSRKGQTPINMPALILLDLKLPRMSGFAVLQKLRANAMTRMLPVVILTSSKEEQDLINSYQLGANSYVRKPVNFHEFAEAVRQLGVYWLILNESPPRVSPS
jgi:two-component system response regulator